MASRGNGRNCRIHEDDCPMKKSFNLLLLLSVLFFLLPSPVPSQVKTAPSFALFNTEGKLVTLGGILKDSNCVIAFWASYCAPCKKEMPDLVGLERKYGRSKNLRLVLINIDAEGKDKALQALREIGIERECLLDMYQVTAKKYIPSLKIPATFLVHRGGGIRFQAVGESKDNLANLEKAILSLR